MKIEHYISQLLYRFPCVTVPGFGAFLAETQPAQLDEGSNAFYPPKKLISFNAYLRHNDGLLANHIATTERTSFEAAVDSIQSEVSIWENILELNGRFTLKNVGELSLNPERNLVFKPHELQNYLKDAFGLSSFVSPAVRREGYKEAVQALEEKAPIAFTPERRKARAYWKYSAVLVLSLAISGTVGYNLYQRQVASQTLEVERNVQQQLQHKIQEATFVIDAPMPAVTLAVNSEQMPYHVVAGAFREEANAQRKYKELLKEGYKAMRLPANRHGLLPVIYGSYPTYHEAWKAMSEIQRSENPDAWVLVKELQ
jgi:hypothetical protein